MSIESCDSQRMKSEQDTLPGKYQNNQLLLFFINDSETEGTLFCCSISYILGFTEQITVRQLDFKYVFIPTKTYKVPFESKNFTQKYFDC